MQMIFLSEYIEYFPAEWQHAFSKYTDTTFKVPLNKISEVLLRFNWYSTDEGAVFWAIAYMCLQEGFIPEMRHLMEIKNAIRRPPVYRDKFHTWLLYRFLDVRNAEKSLHLPKHLYNP